MNKKVFIFFPSEADHIILKTVDFWKKFFQDSFRYLTTETIIRPKIYNTAQAQAKQIIIESCKYIPRRYLRFKQRMLCRLLSWLK